MARQRRGRALLTETERERIADEAGDPQARRVAIAHARTRIEDELADDVTILADHAPELFETVAETVDAGRD
jgi:hypothetical protein